MRYHVIHRTTYVYESPVTVCHYHARLEPRLLPGQACPWHELTIHPAPVERAKRADAYGNACVYFEIEVPHQKLEVIARSLVELRPPTALDPELTPAWEDVRDACHGDQPGPAAAAGEFAFASPLIPTGAAFADYALPCFPPRRPVLAGICELNRRLHEDFVFDPAATDLATPVAEVFANRRGVCQDFAQVMIACLRSLGLPARYVSGYLRTQASDGVPHIGADASHAWVQVWAPGTPGVPADGWLDLDPTNDLVPAADHVRLATGRDYGDVAPLRGVIRGGGRHVLTVGVTTRPVQRAAEAGPGVATLLPGEVAR